MPEGERGPIEVFDNEVQPSTPETADAKRRTAFLANKEMYRLSGSAELVEQDFDRYSTSNAEVDAALPDIIEKCLRSSDLHEKLSGIKLLPFIPETIDITSLVQEIFDDPMLGASQAVPFIPRANQEVRDKLEGIMFWRVDERLRHRDYSVRQEGVKFIPAVPSNERGPFIVKALQDTDFDVRNAGVEAIPSAPLEDRASLIEKAMNDPVQELQLRAVKLISDAKPSDRLHLIELALPGKWVIREAAVKCIRDLAPDEQVAVWGRLIPMIEDGLRSKNAATARFAADLIPEVPIEERQRLIKSAMEHEDLGVRATVEESKRKQVGFAAADMLSDEDEAQIERLKELASTTPLYQGQPEQFFRRPFEKTGTETTLLDRVLGQEDVSLRNRAIIRHIDLEAYLNWRRVYEAAGVWKKHGFDYVPIEPIVKVRLNKSGGVDVVTRVVQGPAIATWARGSKLYNHLITEQTKKIDDVLDELGVAHGHTHGGNYLIHLQRDTEGNVDFEQIPRIYLIDFDQAVSESE